MPVKVPMTGVDLSDTACLFPASGGAPELSPAAVRLSYELATAAYTMDPGRWLQAGWQDCSFLVNRSVITGEMLNSSGTPLNGLTRAALQKFARLKMSALNPVEQVMSLHQPEQESASLKAIVMIRPQGEQMIVAVGFMGTGKQLGDWEANLRMAVRDGLHEGFLQLAQEFIEKLPQIRFPWAAGVLKQPDLSLREIIDGLKQPGSPFRLWVCGHSQGGAAMQTFIDRLLQDGVRREYLRGFGFASPTVAHPGRPLPPDGYPITHIMNADDLVPRLGAWAHLGECLAFDPAEDDRAKMYGPAAQDPCTLQARRLLEQAETAPEALLDGIAILRVLRRQSEATLRRVLGETEQMPFTDLLNAGEDSVLSLLDRVAGRLEQGYLYVSGEADLPEARLSALTGAWEALLREHGAAAWIRGIKNACILPHRLYDAAGDEIPSYFYIVTEGLDRLRPAADPSAPPAVLDRGTTAPEAVKRVYRPAVPRPLLPHAAAIRLRRYAASLRLLAASHALKRRK